MVELQKTRIDQAISTMIDDIDKNHLRQLQAKMFRCAAECCDRKEDSVNSVHKCIDNCGERLTRAQKFVQGEFDHFQDRLQRCIMTCNDTVKDKIGVDATESEVARYTREFEDCAAKCVDSHLGLVPSILKKMKDMLKKHEFSGQ